jgi:hypothetical protein
MLPLLCFMLSFLCLLQLHAENKYLLLFLGEQLIEQPHFLRMVLCNLLLLLRQESYSLLQCSHLAVHVH